MVGFKISLHWWGWWFLNKKTLAVHSSISLALKLMPHPPWRTYSHEILQLCSRHYFPGSPMNQPRPCYVLRVLRLSSRTSWDVETVEPPKGLRFGGVKSQKSCRVLKGLVGFCCFIVLYVDVERIDGGRGICVFHYHEWNYQLNTWHVKSK